LLAGVRKRILDLISSGVQNVWFECRKEGALDRLRLILRFDADDFADVLKYGGLLTKDRKFKLKAFIEGTKLDVEERLTNTQQSGHERWIRFIGDRMQLCMFATHESASKLMPGDQRLMEFEEHFYAQIITSPK